MNKHFIILLLFTFIGFNSIAQNLSKGKVFDGEPFLAVNPYNSNHIIVAWMGFTSIQQRFQIKTKVSFDGGNAWSTAQIVAHEFAGYSSADPSIDFNSKGEPILCYIDFTGTTPPVTGGIYIRKSSNGGLDWDTAKEVITTRFDSPKWPIDRPWIKVNRHKTPEEIYVTSMNLNRTETPYNPYISYSLDDGNNFTSRYLDSANWLSGNLIPTPMCSPVVAAEGTFYGTYPSFVVGQALFARSILAKSTSIQSGINYSEVTRLSSTADDNYKDAKKAGLLLSNPANANHIATVGLKTNYGNLDVFYTESIDGGKNWSNEMKINDAPNGNNKMQDMVWGDFDKSGNLVVSWRDRRNANDSSYQNPVELWAAYKHKDSSSFSKNFQINTIKVPYDSVLAKAGNDFHTSLLINDTIHSVWGEMQTGELNIWYYRTLPNGQMVSVQEIASSGSKLTVFPNPAKDKLYFHGGENKAFNATLYDLRGRIILRGKIGNQTFLPLNNIPDGLYLLKIEGIDEVYRVILN